MYLKPFSPVLLSLVLLFISSVMLQGQIDTIGLNQLFEMDLEELMNQKVVTASKFEQSSSEAASSVGVITADEIKIFGYRTLGDVLASQRGNYLSNDKNYLYIGSRGFSRPTDYNNRIVIMIDGHVLNELVYGSAFMGNEMGINLDNIQKIEIIRGPGASIYGSGAMLNIVNLIMKSGEQTDGLTISGSTGSFGKNDFSAVFGKKIKNTDISVSGTGGLSDGENYYFSELDFPEKNNGISTGMDWEKFLGFQTRITNGNFKLEAGYSTRSKGIPTGAFDTDLTGDTRALDDRIFVETSYKQNFREKSSFLFRGYYDDYCYNGTYTTDGVGSYDASVGRWFGGEVQYFRQAGKRNIITAGIEYRYAFRADYREWDNDTVYFDKNFPFSFSSLYAQDQISLLDNLNLTAGLRYDHYSVFGQSFSPRLSLIYTYSKGSSLKLLYSEAFRIPNIYESFYEGVDSHYANPDIKPEKIRAFELAWSHKLSGSFIGSFSVYHFSIKNLIDQILDEDAGMTHFLNLGIAYGTGVEYELKYKPNINSLAFLNVSLQQTRDGKTDEILSNSPSFMIKSGWSLPVTRYFFLVPEVFCETGRNTLAGNKTGNIVLVNAGINTARFLRFFEASLKLRNLFNTKYYFPGGYEHIQDKLIQDSRNISLRLTAHF